MHLPRNRVFWSVSLGHMTNDVFMAMGPVILAAISGVYLDLSPALIGVAVSAQQMTGAVSQPLFGWLSDKGNSRLLGAGGVLWTISLLSLSLVFAMMGNLWLMILTFAGTAIGSGAFHPVGTAHASYKNPTRAASNTALFFLFGQLGLALGPVIAGLLWGLTLAPDGSGGSLLPFFLVSVAALPAVLFMQLSIPRPTPSDDAENRPAVARADMRWRALLLLAGLVVLRGVAYPGSVAFIPVLFRAKGWSPEAYGAITSIFWIASAAAGVYFGSLADRFDQRYVVTGTLLLAAPAYFVLPLLDGPLAFVMVLIAGGLVGGSHSIIVVLAQGMLPGRKGFASGVALGFIFGVGGIGSLVIGYTADGFTLGAWAFAGFGLERTFQAISVFVLLSGLLGMALPASGRPTAKPDISPAAQGAD
jgi:MFS transporter, FSR family, fosmidomycin resistance protein